MWIRIDFQTRYVYDRPARAIVQALRMQPRSNDGQQIQSWRIETDVDAKLRRSEDAFGNIVHTLYTEAPTAQLTLRVVGEVVTTDTAGVLTGSVERLSPLVCLRDTPLTLADGSLRDFAASIGQGEPLHRLHRLMEAVSERVVFTIGSTTVQHTAAQAFAEGQGVCQDHAQIFIACARWMGIPARYVSGHLHRSDGAVDQEAAHAWAEAWVEGLGWVGFDPANGVCPTPHYVRVACGLDALGAAPVRGVSYGGGGERLIVSVKVRESGRRQTQMLGAMRQEQG